MLVQALLRNGGLAAVGRCVKTKRHPKYPHLIQFKYDQIESPMGDPVVQECRGLILDENDNWNVVARPFDKFFNYGEGHAKPIDWTTARVQEKLDGSLIIMYHYDEQWHVATSGTPDAGGEVNGYGFTFAELFQQTYTEMFETLRRAGRPIFLGGLENFTFCFELTSKYNRIVVVHGEPKLTLIGIRHKDGTEYPLNSWLNAGFPTANEYPIQSMEAILATFQTFQPTTQEGYVVVDANFNRVKVKHPGYVALHHLKDGFGPRRMVEIVRQGEISEVITHFPEYAAEFQVIQGKYNALVMEIAADYEELRDIESQKTYALAAVERRCPGALFALRAGQAVTAADYLRSIPEVRMLYLMGLKE